MSTGAAELLPSEGTRSRIPRPRRRRRRALSAAALLAPAPPGPRRARLARLHRLPDRDRARRAARGQRARPARARRAEPQPHRLLRLAARPQPRAPVRRRPARRGRDVAGDLRHARVARGGHHRHGDLDRDRGRSWACSPASTAAGSTRCSRASWTSCCRSRSCCWGSGSAPRAACTAASKGWSSRASATIIFIICIATWPYVGRIVRGLVLSMREREFVEASRALGASNLRIMFREILPNLDRADHRLREPADPHEHPARGGALVPGRGHPPADGELGRDDRARRRRSSTPRGGSWSFPASRCC